VVLASVGLRLDRQGDEMNWLTNIFSSGAKELASTLGDTVVGMSEAHTGKKELALALETLVKARFDKLAEIVTTEIGAKEKVLVAELQQGDAFTKRARPFIAMSGVGMAVIEVVFRFILLVKGNIDFTQVATIPPLVPTEFWLGWGGITGTWAIGRSVEKVKAEGRIGDAAQYVTGSKKQRSMILGGDD